MKKHLLFLCIAFFFLSFHGKAQNGTCTPPVGIDCVTMPMFIDSVWTTAAVSDFTNDATDCNAQDQDYQDYQNKIVSENAGGSFVLHIGLNPSVSAFVGVWIDWNDDLTFGSGEQIYLSSNQITHTIVVVNVPSGADTVIMRVRSANISMGPCDSVSTGETEDYRVVIIDPNNIDENDLLGWSFYPDPAEDFLNLKIDNNSAESEISIVDLLGKTILTEETKNGNLTIDVSALPHGMYFIQCRSGEFVSMKKFLH